MFSLGEISEQLKNVSRKSVGVSFAGQSLILDTADNGNTIEFFFIFIFRCFLHICTMHRLYKNYEKN